MPWMIVHCLPGRAPAVEVRLKARNRSLTASAMSPAQPHPGVAPAASTASGAPAIADVIQILNSHRSELEHRGVRHIAVFGSTARSEASRDSDVDVVLDVDRDVVTSLFDYGEIQQLLEEWMGRHVDVADRSRLRPGMAAELERDEVVAF